MWNLEKKTAYLISIIIVLHLVVIGKRQWKTSFFIFKIRSSPMLGIFLMCDGTLRVRTNTVWRNSDWWTWKSISWWNGSCQTSGLVIILLSTARACAAPAGHITFCCHPSPLTADNIAISIPLATALLHNHTRPTRLLSSYCVEMLGMFISSYQLVISSCLSRGFIYGPRACTCSVLYRIQGLWGCNVFINK